MESVASVKSEEKKDVHIFGDKSNSVKVTFGNRTPTFASQPLKHRLRLSSSLPTLHKTWNAFEIDPDQDDTFTLEEMEALSIAAQNRPKRATLDGIHIPKELEDRAIPTSYESDENRVIHVTSDNFLDINRAARTLQSSPDNSSVQVTPKSSPMASPNGSGRSSPRSSLARMDFSALRRLSEEDSLEKLYALENVENDKENKPPQAQSKNSALGTYHRQPNIQTLSVTQYSPRQSLSIRVPKAKIDRCTQVTYNEIKAETAWTKPDAFIRRRRVIVKDSVVDVTSSSSADKSIAMEQSLLGNENPPFGNKNCPSENRNPQTGKVMTEKYIENSSQLFHDTNKTSRLRHAANVSSQLRHDVDTTSQTHQDINVTSSISSPDTKQDVKSPVTVCIYPDERPNSIAVTSQVVHSPQYLAQPHRQSTVETIDSGIADDQNRCSPQIVVSNAPRLSLDCRMVPKRLQPRFENGHRVVTRQAFFFLFLKCFLLSKRLKHL